MTKRIKQLKHIKTPHTYALLLSIIVCASVLTYIIPAGAYDREKKDGQTLVVSGTYHEINQHGVSFLIYFVQYQKGLLVVAKLYFISFSWWRVWNSS